MDYLQAVVLHLAAATPVALNLNYPEFPDSLNSRPLKNSFTLLKEQGLLPGVRLPEVK
jgi:hypothetical protein